MRILTPKDGIPVVGPGPLRRLWIWFKYGVQSTWFWFPVIWSDRHWDHAFLYRIMRHKIAGMHEASKDWMSVEREERTSELWDTIKLLDELLDDVHEDAAFREHEKLFGRSEWHFVPVPDDEKLSELITTYPKADDQEKAKEALISFMRMAALARQATLDALGRAIAYYSERWWD